jgi:hypothetical protein
MKLGGAGGNGENVHTAQIEGRSHQAHDDHEGGMFRQLALLHHRFDLVTGLRLICDEAVAERALQKVSSEDDLWQVTPSAGFAPLRNGAKQQPMEPFWRMWQKQGRAGGTPHKLRPRRTC